MNWNRYIVMVFCVLAFATLMACVGQYQKIQHGIVSDKNKRSLKVFVSKERLSSRFSETYRRSWLEKFDFFPSELLYKSLRKTLKESFNLSDGNDYDIKVSPEIMNISWKKLKVIKQLEKKGVLYIYTKYECDLMVDITVLNASRDKILFTQKKTSDSGMAYDSTTYYKDPEFVKKATLGSDIKAKQVAMKNAIYAM